MFVLAVISVMVQIKIKADINADIFSLLLLKFNDTKMIPVIIFEKKLRINKY
jgi:hypothetical protein